MGVQVGPVRSISCEILQKRFKLHIASLNVGTMQGRPCDVVEALARKITNICTIQETRRTGCSAWVIIGKHCRYKFLWSGNNSGFGGVGTLVAEKWIEKTISVDWTSSQQMPSWLVGRFCTSFLFMLLKLGCQSPRNTTSSSKSLVGSQ